MRVFLGKMWRFLYWRTYPTYSRNASRLADYLSKRWGPLARRVRSPFPWLEPYRRSQLHLSREGALGDVLMCTPAKSLRHPGLRRPDQRSAKPSSPVRIRAAPLTSVNDWRRQRATKSLVYQYAPSHRQQYKRPRCYVGRRQITTSNVPRALPKALPTFCPVTLA
jgi:hypothetical protein